MDLFHVGHGLFSRSHVGLGDDLDQRRTRPVEVYGRHAHALVLRLAGVFFEMRAGNAYALDAAIFEHDVETAAGDYGQLVLADLIALGQVGVEVVLARKHRATGDVSAHCQTELDRHAHGLAIEHRQHARIAQIDQIGLGVGLCAVGRG